MTPAREIIHALRGKWHGGYGTARCPAHDDRTPSLSVRDGDGRVLVKCHSGCRQEHVIASLTRLGFWHGRDEPRIEPTRAPRPKPVPEDRERTANALGIWHEAGPPHDTPAWLHLIARGIDVEQLPGDMSHSLRWHPQCPWERGRQGCMLALFTDAVTGEAKAIHRTAIDPAGNKIGRKSLGPIAGCVIRLWPDDAVSEGLVVGEGLETTLSAATRIEHKGTKLQPAWAAGDAGNMAKLPVLSGVEAITLLVDNDAKRRGQNAALECSNRWMAAGREVVRLIPWGVGADFNDVAREVSP
jgi:putative DNA primase/helicase